MNRLEKMQAVKDCQAIAVGKVDEANKIEAGLEKVKLDLSGLGASTTAELKEIREDLQADVALGKASTQQLKDLDAKVAKAVELDSKRSELSQTIAGIQRKQELILAEVKKAGENKAKAISDYVRAEAEEVGAEYAKAVSDVCRLFRQLQALSVIDGHTGCSPGPMSYGLQLSNKMFIPTFMLDALSGLSSPTAVTVFTEVSEISNTNYGFQMDRDVDTEKKRLESIGIVFS